MELRSSSSNLKRTLDQYVTDYDTTGTKQKLVKQDVKQDVKRDVKRAIQTKLPYLKQETTKSITENKQKTKATSNKATITDIESLVTDSKSMPKNWLSVYNAIRAYRAQIIAPVDVAGCHILGDRRRGPKTFRFQTLVALMLSAQTKDQTTAQAMHRLRVRFGGLGDAEAYQQQDPSEAGELGDAIVSGVDQQDGFTAWTLAAASIVDIGKCIEKVGFHLRKSNFIRETASICVEKYQGDIPDTLQGLLDLPGVGPKMALLALQAAWGKSIGIGVDTHVHRISNRLGWVHTKQPEETRRVLETFVPHEYWAPINPLLVGFGQTTCLPVSPLCSKCPVKDVCPFSTQRSKKTR